MSHAQGSPHKLHSLIKARCENARAVLVLRENPKRRPVHPGDYFFVDTRAVFTSVLIETRYDDHTRADGAAGP